MPTTKYIWDPESDNVLMETDESDVTTAVYTNEPDQFGNLISQRRGSTTITCLYDALGSTRQLTNATENTTDTYIYTAFGESVASTGTTINPFRYVGELGYYYDTETNDYYVRAREYDPVIARWISRDPVGFSGSTTLVYEYAMSNPVNHLDPSGERPFPIPIPIPKLFPVPLPVPHPIGVRCFNPCVGNGCGPKKNLILQILILNRPIPFGADFKRCCDDHDVCYCICGAPKKQCDDIFLNCMRAACLDLYPRFPGNPILDAASAFFRSGCYLWAGRYAAGVRSRFGNKPYVDGQNLGCANCNCTSMIA